MYRTRINNIFANKFENLLDAKKDALMSFKDNNTLVEVLDDDDNVVFSKEPIEDTKIELTEPTEDLVENGVNSLIRTLIVEGWKSIDDYNSTLATISSEDPENDRVIETLNNILDDLNTHIGMLEECLVE